jgi:hypothetical protein
MCTVTSVPVDDGFRLVCNRDERRDRPAAAPPAVHRLQRSTAIYPVDPAGGGTWVGLNDTGLAAVLLNRTIVSTASPGCAPLYSRGRIIPSLLGCRSLPDALETAAQLDPTRFGLFRLLLVQRMAAVVLTSDGLALSVDSMSPSQPFMLTSSSLGDAVVEAPRRRLFERLLQKDDRALAAAQARFHAHQWRRRGEVSVTMERPDARTVSRTCITVTSRAIELCYEPLCSEKPRAVRVSDVGTGPQWTSST